MEFTGRIQNITKDWQSDQYQITFTINEPSAVKEIDAIKDCERLNIRAEKYKDNRSNNANRLLWHCLSEIGKAMTPPIDKWEVYLQMLRRYGKYTYMLVKPNAVEDLKAIWRESEDIGEIDVNGQKAVQMLCYYGSSTYDTKEFSVLLEGVISEMEQMGLQTPTSQEMKIALEQWEKMQK